MSAGTQIDWDAAAKQAGVPLTGAASPSSGGGIDWDAAERQAKGTAAAPKPGFVQGFKDTFAPTQMWNQARDTFSNAKNAYHAIAHGTPEQRDAAIYEGIRGALPVTARMAVPSVEDAEAAAQEGKSPEAEHIGSFRQGVKALPKTIASEETPTRMAGQGVGLVANEFLPGIGEEADEAEGEGLLGRLASRVEEPKAIRATRKFVTAARTKPEEIAEKASEPLEAATGQQQERLNTALKTARQNLSPLYENIHATDAGRNPEGAIHVPEEISQQFAPKAAPADKLNAKELSDAGLAGKQATRFIADGMSDAEASRTLTGLGYSPKVVRRALADVAYPEQGGGYTIEKARALRTKLYRAADAAEGREDFQAQRNFTEQARDLTGAMRERVRDLDPQGRLLADFDRADAAYGQAREDQRVLRPLTEAMEGDRTPSAEKFQKAWDGMSSAQRNALGRLAKNAGLNIPEMEEGAATSGKVVRGTKPVRTDWMDRYVKGAIPARLALAGVMGGLGYMGGRNKAIPEWARQAMYLLPTLIGYGGVGMVKPILARGAALDAMEGLPKAAPRPSYRPTVPIVSREQLERELAQGSSQFMPSAGARRALPETTEPRAIGPRRQLPPSSAPSGEPINAAGYVRPILPSGMDRSDMPRWLLEEGGHEGLNVLPSGARSVTASGVPTRETPLLPGGRLPRPVRGLLAKQNLNELPSSGEVITPGARLALPPGTPTEPIGKRMRTIGGRVIGPGGNIEGYTAEGSEKEATGHGASQSANEEDRTLSPAEQRVQGRIDEIDARIANTKSASKLRNLTRDRKQLVGELEGARQKGSAYSAEQEYAPETIQSAKEEMVAALRLWDELPAPERIRIDDYDEQGNRVRAQDRNQWIGVGSPRGAVEDMYPWVKQVKGYDLSDLKAALRKGKGAAFDRWLRAAADFVEKQGREPGEE